VTEGMFAAAARRLADEVREEDISAGSLFPPQSEIRRVTAAIAEAVVRKARDERVGRQIPDEAIPPVVAAAMWQPDYVVEEPA
jgi:malate dehydrogenase (oxaloacetate-decarboxylating)